MFTLYTYTGNWLCLLNSIKFDVAQGKEGIIDFTSGSELLVAKAKNGHLSVVNIYPSIYHSAFIYPAEHTKICRVLFFRLHLASTLDDRQVMTKQFLFLQICSLIRQSHDYRQSFSLPIRCQPAAPKGLCFWLWKSSKLIYVLGINTVLWFYIWSQEITIYVHFSCTLV